MSYSMHRENELYAKLKALMLESLLLERSTAMPATRVYPIADRRCFELRVTEDSRGSGLNHSLSGTLHIGSTLSYPYGHASLVHKEVLLKEVRVRRDVMRWRTGPLAIPQRVSKDRPVEAMNYLLSTTAIRRHLTEIGPEESIDLTFEEGSITHRLTIWPLEYEIRTRCGKDEYRHKALAVLDLDAFHREVIRTVNKLQCPI